MPHASLRVSVRQKLISTQCEMFQRFRLPEQPGAPRVANRDAPCRDEMERTGVDSLIVGWAWACRLCDPNPDAVIGFLS